MRYIMNNKFEPLSKKKRQVIIDTDIGPDCDDAGALATAIYYAKEYDFPIIGICNCTSNPAGNATIDAICKFCDYPTPPTAKYEKNGFFDDKQYCTYNTEIARRFAPEYLSPNKEIEGAVSFYRRLLANASDGEVMIISIGMLNNISALLDSPADEISSLDGKALVRKKVYGMVSMGTCYPEGREFNIYCAIDAAKNVIENFGVPIYFSDFHIGASVHTCIADLEEKYAAKGRSAEDNPIYLAYKLFTSTYHIMPITVRPTWDLTTVQFAVLGEGEYYGSTEPGHLEFYEEKDGVADATRYIPNPNGNCYFITKNAADTVIAAELERILKSF